MRNLIFSSDKNIKGIIIMVTDTLVKNILRIIMQHMISNLNTPREFRNGCLLLPCKPWNRIISKSAKIDLSIIINYLYEKDCIQNKGFNFTIDGNIYKNYVIDLSKIYELFNIDMDLNKILTII